jgi:predicted metal-dependent hydrolase
VDAPTHDNHHPYARTDGDAREHLNFNTELLDPDSELSDYVIVHELLHFATPNHGKLRKSRMMAHLGDHEQLAERLRRVAGRR